MQFYLPITKVDKQQRMVWGYASTPTKDLQGEIVEINALKNALPDYMQWANIREMHQPSAVGVTKEAKVDDSGLYIGAKIVDDEAWTKVMEQVYKGFSIGGERLAKVGDKITEMKLYEISLVDRPANPDCKIEVVKVAQPIGTHKAQEGFTREEVGWLGRIIAKLTGNPPAAHDGFSLPAGPDGVVDERGQNRMKHLPSENEGGLTSLPTKCPNCGKFVAEEDENCKSCGHEIPAHKRAFSDEHRNRLAREGKAMPDGSFPIETEKDLINAIHAYGRASDKPRVQEHIIRQAKRLGLTDLLPAHWPGSTKDPKKAIGDIELTKRLAEAIMPLSAAFEAIRSVQRGLIAESQTENGDGTDEKLSQQLAQIAHDLAQVISSKAAHEGKEAQSLTDENDILFSELTGTRLTNMATSPELNKRYSAAHKEAVSKAAGHVRKALDCNAVGKSCLHKAARSAAELHKILSKSEKAAQEPFTSEDLENITHHVGKIADHLSEAHQQLGETGDHLDVAHLHLGKAISHWVGEHGEAPGDAEDGIYDPESGLTPLAQDKLTEGDVPSYSSNNPYPTTQGKQKPGKVTPEGIKSAAEISDLQKQLLEAREQSAYLRGLTEAMSKFPTMNRVRSFASIDKGMFPGSNADHVDDKKASLMEGIQFDPNDPDSAVRSGARMIGNMIRNPGKFGKSIFDPSFKGAVGK